MKLGIPVYEGVNLLDVAGPYEMFTWVNEEGEPKRLEVLLVSEDGGPVKTVNGLRFDADTSFADAGPLEVLWVPGGDPNVLGRMMSNPDSPYFEYLRSTAEDAKWVCSVCEGALLAARAGILDGHKVTTHWRFVECLKQFAHVEVVPGMPRYVLSGNRLTGGGISSGLDESLKLIELLFGAGLAEQVQLITQYFPDPPVQAQPPLPPRDCPLRW